MSNVTGIKASLLAKLNAMQSLKAAYGWETSNPSGNYPFATLTLRAGEGEFRSTFHNLRRERFRVRIYQEQNRPQGQGPAAAETISTNVLDEFLTAVDMDTTLSGTCKYVKPVRWDASYQDRDVDTRILEIDIDAFEITSAK